MNKKGLLIFGIGLLVAFGLFTYLRYNPQRLHTVSGQTMGAIVYNVKYLAKEERVSKSETDSLLVAFNQSLSTYIPNSEISELNRTGKLTYQTPYLYSVLQESKKIFTKTHQAFDPTVGPLIQAWGFGPDEKIPDLDTAQVDSLLALTGFEHVVFDTDSISIPRDHQLDFSAIAKGYAVDLVGELLESKGIRNYLVEIGGEVRCRGVNDQQKSWSLGIEDPTVAMNEQEILAIVRLQNKSLATSGNYRNYYKKDGKLHAHIVDPRTGYTAQHSLLSASVFSDYCITADAYATAFMVLGLDRAKQIIQQEPIDGILVYQSESGELNSYISKGIQPFVELNKAK